MGLKTFISGVVRQIKFDMKRRPLIVTDVDKLECLTRGERLAIIERCSSSNKDIAYRGNGFSKIKSGIDGSVTIIFKPNTWVIYKMLEAKPDV